MAIEVEIRTFISPETYLQLIKFFTQQGTLINTDKQETHYLDAGQDLRIQKNNFYSKIWLKKGEMHSEQREEIEIKFPKEEFVNLELLFKTLGYSTTIKWFRERHTFLWDGITIMLDSTKGYGYILELEKMSTLEEQDKDLLDLKSKLISLGINLTPKEEFDLRYKYYKDNWHNLV